MSDLESICARTPVCGEGNDSGEAYSNVPVFPDRVREFTMSCDVPKSDSIARGISFPWSHVSRTFPGFRSRCNIDLLCLSDSQNTEHPEGWDPTKNASPAVTSRNKLFTSSAPSK